MRDTSHCFKYCFDVFLTGPCFEDCSELCVKVLVCFEQHGEVSHWTLYNPCTSGPACKNTFALFVPKIIRK